MWTHILYSAIAVVTAALVANAIYNLFFHPLRKVPGPYSHAASRWPYIYHTLTGKLAFHLHDLHQQYGPVVRTAPDDVSFISEEAVKVLHTRKDSAGHIFSKNYDTWEETDNYFTHSVFLAGHEKHRRLRKALGTAFTEPMLREHESTIQNNIDKFVTQISKDVRADPVAPTDRPSAHLDLDQRSHWLAFDSIAEFVFGESFHSLTSAKHRPWLRNLYNTWKFIAVISSMNQIASAATTLLAPTGLLQSRVDTLVPFDEKTEEQLEKLPEKPTLLSIGKEAELSATELMANAALFTIAGMDTTATVMPSVVYLLLRNPRCLELVRKEVDSLTGEGEITIARVREMSYLNACIQEAMRIHPPVPEGMPRVVPEGQSISGYWMPARTAVQISPLAAYRSALNFEQPDAFIPERWISDSPDAPNDPAKGVFMPFSAGPRGCPGRNFAMAEVSLGLVKLFWHFDVTLGSDDDWLHQNSYFFWEKKALDLKVMPRSRNIQDLVEM